MKTLGEFISEKRKERGFSAKTLAERAGISDAHVIFIEQGQRQPTLNVVLRLLDALSIDIEEVLKETRSKAAPTNIEISANMIPLISWQKAGLWKKIRDTVGPEDVEKWIASDLRGKNLFALRVADDSMKPEFMEGDLITIDSTSAIATGDFVIVKSGKTGVACRQLKKFGSRWVLNPLNPIYAELETTRKDFSIIGKIVKKEKRY